MTKDISLHSLYEQISELQEQVEGLKSVVINIHYNLVKMRDRINNGESVEAVLKDVARESSGAAVTGLT